MTNHWIDLRNSDCILIMGANPAENHPVSFKWITEAVNRGARLISVDPRFTRTSAKAHLYAALRSGTDLAFLGGMIRYILENKMFLKAYVAEYTNAPFLLHEGFRFQDGLFSGFDPTTNTYDRAGWAFWMDEEGNPRKDPTLENPRTVFQMLKSHFSRYDPETVSAVTGTPVEDLLKVYEAYAATGEKGKAGTILYAMGWTQHTVGTQNIRAMAIIQLLLGNMGVAGGGVNALRGESNVQGSTDHGLLFDSLPGYLKTPCASDATLARYLDRVTPKTDEPRSANWWSHYPKYVVSLLKSLFGEKATQENEFGFAWLPRLDDGGSYSWLELFDAMYRGAFAGFLAWGQNPACSGANANKTREALTRLEWMVNVNLFDNETASFWRGPGMDPEKIQTEVFFLPCAASVEKEGSITNSGRWMQWRYEAARPRGEAMADGDIILKLFSKVRELYARDSAGMFPEPILNLQWHYASHDRFDPHKVAREINGRFLQDTTVNGQTFQAGTQVPGFAWLQADGSTSSGNWIYCHSYTDEGNQAARRIREAEGLGLNPGWAWCWPMNRRILYNRASVDLQGRPWDLKRPVIQWDPEANQGMGAWQGDVPDGGWPPLEKADGTPDPDSRYPFLMKPEGIAAIFGPGMADGPFPEHYEPLECPINKNPFSGQLKNPLTILFTTRMDVLGACDLRYPFVGTTYRVCEHWQSGVMTRWQPWLLETQPQLFVEMSHELATLRGIRNGERVVVASARGRVEAVAVVTARFRPFTVQGKVIHEVGLPWHYGWVTPPGGGDSANLLTSSAGDPNTRIPETKAFMVDIRKA